MSHCAIDRHLICFPNHPAKRDGRFDWIIAFLVTAMAENPPSGIPKKVWGVCSKGFIAFSGLKS